MKAKVLTLCLLVLFAFGLCAPLGAYADVQETSATSIVSTREELPEFDPVEGENSTDITVKPADKKTMTGWEVTYSFDCIGCSCLRWTCDIIFCQI